MKRNAVMVGLVLVFLLLLSSVSIVYRNKSTKKGTSVCIYRNNELLEKIDVREITEPYTIRIEGEDGAYNVLEIQEGAIGIIDASCPDHLCENMGFVSSAWMPITCLPNHLIVRLETEENSMENAMDGIAY